MNNSAFYLNLNTRVGTYLILNVISVLMCFDSITLQSYSNYISYPVLKQRI